MTGIVVQKFGGTSIVDDAARKRAARLVAEKRSAGYAPVVVVSAIGRFGDPYSTDSLLHLAKSSGAGLGDREHDLIASCGEVISAVVFAQSLAAEGIGSTPLTGGQAGVMTTGNFSRSRIIGMETSGVRNIIDQNRVPVIAGFQGVSEDGEVMTIGRGGSDTSACLIAAALGAEYVEIIKDVDGVMTADPRVVEDARLISAVQYPEVQALALNGSRVIHAKAVEAASRAGLRISVRSGISQSPGTMISFDEHSRPVTGISSIPDIIFFEVSQNGDDEARRNWDIFQGIAEAEISIHFIDFRQRRVTFVVESSRANDVRQMLDDCGLKFKASGGYAKVSVVGVGMTGQPGMFATVIRALGERNIEIHQLTDAPTSISCLVTQENEHRAIRALHDAFHLGES